MGESFPQPVSGDAAPFVPVSHSQSGVNAPPTIPLHHAVNGRHSPFLASSAMPKTATAPDIHTASDVGSREVGFSSAAKTQARDSPALRSPYTRQFSVATELILGRIKKRPSSDADTVTVPLNRSTQERQTRINSAWCNSSDGGGLERGETVSSTFIKPSPVAKDSPMLTSVRPSVESASKRKRDRGQEDEMAAFPRKQKDSSPLAEITVGGVDADTPSSVSAISEDDVSSRKSTLYNPDAVRAVEIAQRRLRNTKSHGFNGGPHIRCERCARTVSPMFNRMVPCSSCNASWHQLCHEPEIDDSLIQHENSSWSCAKCTAERSRLVGPKRIKFVSSNTSGNGNKRRLVNNSDLKKTISITPPTRDAIPDSMRVSWADHSAGQKLAYLSTLSGGELVQLLMRSTELHPDLPIFPSTTKPVPAQPPVIDHTLRNDSQSNTGSYRKGTMNLIQKSASSATKAKLPSQSIKGGNSKAVGSRHGHESPTKITAKAVLGTQIDPDEEDPTGLMDAWPQPGQGLYAALCPDGDDETLVDDNDYDTFSHIIYDNSGRKARENDIALLVQ